jgi:hypothetical protein
MEQEIQEIKDFKSSRFNFGFFRITNPTIGEIQ